MARLVSIAGSSATNVALSYYLWTSTHSSVWVAAGALSGSLVLGLASMPAGALADRFDRRRVMISSDLLAAIVFSMLALAVWQDSPPLLLVVLMGLASLAESPFMAASQAAIPNLVDDEDIPWANVLMGRVQTIVSAIAPAAGGAIAALWGPTAVLGLNAVSFVGSALLVASIRASFDQKHSAEEHPQQESRSRIAGLRVAWSNRLLRAVIFPGFIAFIGVGFVIVANPQLADSYGLDAFGLGLIWGAWSVGAFAVSFVVGRFLTPGREFGIAAFGLILHAVAMTGIWLLQPLALVLLANAIGGAGVGVTGPARQTLIQRQTIDSVRGSVFGVMESVGWLSFAVSLVTAGLLVDAVGVRNSFGIAAALFVAGVVLMYVMRGPRPPVVHQAVGSDSLQK